MNEELNPTEENAIDVLLAEVHGANGPRDFTREIFAHLSAPQVRQNEWIAPAVSVSKTRGRAKRSLHWIWTPVVVSIAASLLIAVLYGRANKPQPNVTPTIAGKIEKSPAVPVQTSKDDSKPASELASNDSALESVAESSEKKSSSLKSFEDEWDEIPSHGFEPQGIELTTDSAEDSSTISKFAAGPRSEKPVLESQPVQLVSKRVSDQMLAYWREVGVKPTDEASAENVLRRIAISLGVRVSKEDLHDVERLQKQLSKPTEAWMIATRWLNHVSMNAFVRMNEVDREKLTSVFANTIRNRKGFDRAISDLISGNDPMSSLWYTAIGMRGADAMYSQLAAVSMNQDLRCTRCHDSLMEGMGQQADHWSFVAVVKTRVRGNEQGQWELLSRAAVDGAENNLFYDLPDGRRRLAKPAVASKWMGMNASEPASTLDQWADDLIGSRPLADGLVNSLWQTLYGRSLIGSIVDSKQTLDQKFLLQIQKELSDDLIASDFNVARTLALMISSPSFQRSVPDVLEPQREILARRDQLDQAKKVVDAYAGAAPPRSTIRMNRRVAHVLRVSGASIDFAGGLSASLLGQADIAQSNATPGKSISQPNPTESPVDFPTEGTPLSMEWLGKISDFDAKVDHLAYLSGRGRVPSPLLTVVDALHGAETNDELVLQRIWWLLSH